VRCEYRALVSLHALVETSASLDRRAITSPKGRAFLPYARASKPKRNIADGQMRRCESGGFTQYRTANRFVNERLGAAARIPVVIQEVMETAFGKGASQDRPALECHREIEWPARDDASTSGNYAGILAVRSVHGPFVRVTWLHCFGESRALDR
jgi:hypothetical protein